MICSKDKQPAPLPTGPDGQPGFVALDDRGKPIDVRLAEPTWEQAKEVRICVNPRHHVFERLERISRKDLERLATQAEKAWANERLARHFIRWRSCVVVLKHRDEHAKARRARRSA